MSNLVVVYDACVLYPAPLRDTLMRVGIADLCQARWTDKILDEWVSNLLEHRPDITKERLERTCSKMKEAIPDCTIAGYDYLIDRIELPDPDDRHVLAAAIHAKAQLIVTNNRSDFPLKTLEMYDLQCCHPDAFLTRLYESAPEDVIEVLREQRAALKKPSQTVEEFLATLNRNGLNVLVQLLQLRKKSL
ncbi:MAG TPA: PIN domain-containing protein [Capsulimonadaceae bacterium]|nr:PIN domain-containing protein [Capsulimonadaceae bacterium]